MNCTQFEQMLDDYIDGSLSTIQLSQTQAHLNNCAHCQKSYTQANELLGALKDIPVPPAKAGYEERVLSFLEHKQEKTTQHHNWFFAGFGSAVAASFALWLVFSPIALFSDKTENINTVNLLVEKKQTVDLVFNLTSDLADATLTIDLPEHVVIAGYAGKRQLSWKTSFKKGANRLALPLIAKEQFDGILVAHLIKQGKTKSFRVRLNSTQPSTKLMINNELATINT